MLLKDFYTINSIDKKDDHNFEVVIYINENHEVFKGHFPGNPVMPGVCMIQIIKELTEQFTKSFLIMQTLASVKFTALINPFVTPELRLELSIVITDDYLVQVKNTTYFNETLALKLSGVYKKTAARNSF
ncbi:3-hydroxyacyl-ACP dehydratase [Flavobacterium sp.]|uniref:3-hydroxyacyl-ACP dehydratase n=1 Tax=Flavobacterium sp. TaxID=239 RepID=UPI0025CBCE2A|nr:3-hydroxyacyl-ACP dehydratase [Flavobacterium sp.]